ncbi:PepSY-associated TM helix domain-containing protein [Sphingobium sp. YR657]|uniref:PepSY-associated TM helix domain-containing protein n=1 Tax=Sphingobium sp. YR657 TaxID=1884366 RepID=UPI003137A6E2
MAWLHTWAGLVLGWLMFVIFLFGTASYFQLEISRWMRPELRGGEVTDMALDAAARFLTARAPGAGRWSLSLPSGRGNEAMLVSWEPREGSEGDVGEAPLDPLTGQVVALRDTRGGEFLYTFHYQLHYMEWWLGRYLVIVAALAMLVALLSGIITHKKIFADFFLLRFGKGQRSWLDAHNVTGVLALPFHLMITYTGLVTLMFMAMPWAINASFPDRDALYGASSPAALNREASGNTAPSLPFSGLLDRARVAGDGFDPGYITIRNPGDAAAVAEIWPQNSRLVTRGRPIYLDGVTGTPLFAPSSRGAAAATQDVKIALHAGRFSLPVLRWLYFLSGVGGTLMITTGLVLWTVKRRAKLPDPARPHFGFRLVERLNIGVIGGAPAGISVYFLANRLLPLHLGHHADWEVNSLFIAWGALIVWTIARPAKRAWIEALTVCAILFGMVPVVNALTTARGFIPSLIARDWVFASFDGTMLAMSAACAFAAWKTASHKPRSASRGEARAFVEVAL